MRILEGLGLATLAWLGLALVEIALRDQAGDLPLLLGYLPAAALLWSAAFGAVVLLVHGLHRLLARRWPARALFGTAALVALAGAPFCFVLSGALVEGEWIAKQSWAGVARIGLAVVLELAWLSAWGVYAASSVVQGWGVRVALGLASFVGLVAISLALQGPLLAYTALAKHAVFPAWLLAFGLACQLAVLAPRAARYAALGAVAIGALCAGYAALERDLAGYAGTELAATSSFAGIAETIVAGRAGQIAELPFDRVRGSACPKARQPEPLALRPEQRRNVIWFSVDTVRRDAIGKRFGERAVAPSLEAFAKRSVLFNRAVSPAAGTLFSLSVAVSGQSTSQLFYMRKPPRNIFQRVRAVLPEQRIVMPEWSVFRSRPYKKLVTQRAKVAVPRTKNGDQLKPFIEALKLAKAGGKRGFFWLHLASPHSPYAKHNEFNFGSSKPARYYGEVAYDDAILGRAFEYLEKHGYFEDSLIVMFSDHGEALGENGYFGHGIAMRARYTDVPVIVRYPGVVPRVSNAAVSLQNLAATVLHYLGLPLPKLINDCSLLQSEAALARCAPPVSTGYGLHHSFLNKALDSPIASHEDLGPRRALIRRRLAHTPELALTTSERRYLYNFESGGERLFDRTRDPLEKQNLARSERAELARLRALAERWAEDEATRIACEVKK